VARSVAQAACTPPVPVLAGQAARGRQYHRKHRLEVAKNWRVLLFTVDNIYLTHSVKVSAI